MRSSRRRFFASTVAVMALAGCSGAPGATYDHVSTPPPGPIATHGMARSAPVRVQVPAISVDSDLIDLGLRDNGTLEVPPDGFPAGWFTGAPTPGEIGPAIIAGHVDWGGEPGVFYELSDLVAGDEITVTGQDGSTAVFRVTEVAEFPKDEFPTELVYGDINYAGLRLITCGGSFDRATGHYEDNIVAFAEFVGTGSA